MSEAIAEHYDKPNGTDESSKGAAVLRLVSIQHDIHKHRDELDPESLTDADYIDLILSATSSSTGPEGADLVTESILQVVGRADDDDHDNPWSRRFSKLEDVAYAQPAHIVDSDDVTARIGGILRATRNRGVGLKTERATLLALFNVRPAVYANEALHEFIDDERWDGIIDKIERKMQG